MSEVDKSLEKTIHLPSQQQSHQYCAILLCCPNLGNAWVSWGKDRRKMGGKGSAHRDCPGSAPALLGSTQRLSSPCCFPPHRHPRSDSKIHRQQLPGAGKVACDPLLYALSSGRRRMEAPPFLAMHWSETQREGPPDTPGAKQTRESDVTHSALLRRLHQCLEQCLAND